MVRLSHLTKLLDRIYLGLDIDGTIAADPAFFADISRLVLKSGGEVHVVSARSAEGRYETTEELAEFGVRFSALHLLPPISAAQALCPHKDLDWYLRHAWLKVDYALVNGISHFVDDESKVLALFARFAPGVSAISFAERHLLRGMVVR